MLCISRSLYSDGTLDPNKNYNNSFKKTNTQNTGAGSIENTRTKSDSYCFKLVGTEPADGSGGGSGNDGGGSNNGGGNKKSSAGECVPDTEPREVRDNVRYTFDLFGADAKCADGNSKTYQYGETSKCKDSGEHVLLCF